jgi:hypothetical protein
LQRHLEQGFPFLPSGSQIVLDAVARNIVLENIRQQVAPKWTALVSEVRAHPDNELASYLDASGRGLEDVLKNNRSWTTLCRDAGKLGAEPGPREADLVKRVRALAHVDDRRRWVAYQALLSRTLEVRSPAEKRLARMLFYSIFPDGGGFDSIADGLEDIANDAVADEMRQVVDIAFDSARRTTVELGSIDPALAEVPLEEVVPGLVEVEVAVPRSRPAVW